MWLEWPGWNGIKELKPTGEHTYKEGECDQTDPNAGTENNTTPDT